MSWKNIRLILMREVRDQLRDRRTLFMIAISPILLYPALGIGMVQMRVTFREQPRSVVILGAEQLPDEPRLIEGNRFVADWFDPPGEAEKLKVLTDVSADSGSNGTEQPSEHLLEQCRRVRDLLEAQAEVAASAAAAKESENPAEAARLARRSYELREQVATVFAAIDVQVLILVPDGFAGRIEQENQEIAHRGAGDSRSVQTPRPRVVQNSADDKSSIAYRRVTEALRRWEQRILERRLDSAGLPSSLPAPVNPQEVDLAQKDQLSANLWSKLVPALMVIMAVTGAFYPAIDVAAGEKERGTMETLLICPAKRSEIVLGKFFTVMLFSIATAVLNLISLGMTGWYMASMAVSGPLSKVENITFPGPLAVLWTVLLLIPLAALFSALCLALATFARSSKEGNYYLYPLLMVTLGLTVFCLVPGVEIEPFYSVMPVVGVALLLRELLASPESTEPMMYVLPVLMTTIAYSLLALWWAIDQFKRETVLFREAERFELRLWIKHLLRDKESQPSFAEAAICFILVMMLQFSSIKFFQRAFSEVPPSSLGAMMLKLLLIQQLVIVACPALFMGVLLTTSVRRTFRLRWPRWQYFGTAALLPLALHPLCVELAASLQWFFPELPEQFGRVVELMADQQQPLWLLVLSFAAAPAICEELAFRGFILSGFARTGRVWLAIVFSSITFGIMHTVPQQVFNATLLGLVLGLIAVRANSLLPCMLFHFLYNAAEVIRSRLSLPQVVDTPADWFVTVSPLTDQPGVRYDWPTLVVAFIVAAFLISRLVVRSDNDSTPADSSGAALPETVVREAPVSQEPPVRVS